ncbi:MAG: nucleoside deaminase [Candidatus Omnitrophica bacterium]|nr:nucleoside deaminase [Candidatus Omnitrophota bacterium]
MNFVPNKKYMRLAIAYARKNLNSRCGGPFGACIVKGGKILALARNTVLKNDPTAHAEINAIREAARKIRNYDLSNCQIYSTTEPCPMCFSAIHWARIDVCIYGTTIADVKKIGFNELRITSREMKRAGKSSIVLVPGFLKKECVGLLRDYDASRCKILY